MTPGQALADAVWLLRHEPEQHPEALRRLDELTDRLLESERNRMPPHMRRAPILAGYRPALQVVGGREA